MNMSISTVVPVVLPSVYAPISVVGARCPATCGYVHLCSGCPMVLLLMDVFISAVVGGTYRQSSASQYLLHACEWCQAVQSSLPSAADTTEGLQGLWERAVETFRLVGEAPDPGALLGGRF